MQKILLVLAISMILAACSPALPAGPDGLGPDLIPPLNLPPGAQPVGGGGGGSDTTLGTEQYLRTDLSLDELYDFYAAQLEDAQWRLISVEKSAETITSTWDFDQAGRAFKGELEVHYGTPDMADAYSVSIRVSLSD